LEALSYSRYIFPRVDTVDWIMMDVFILPLKEEVYYLMMGVMYIIGM